MQHSENEYETIDDVTVWNTVSAHTLTSPQRIQALIDAVRYLDHNRIPGSIVECGVWRGGSMMAAAYALLENHPHREMYLFDTFDGMTTPTDVDVDLRGQSAASLLEGDPQRIGALAAVVPLAEVKRNLASTGYPDHLVHFIVGDVLTTLPDHAPSEIALLRLDTDWYESTRHELVHLVPRISKGGVLIVDDYGHWKGARRAVDEYFQSSELKILLNRIDYTGRIAVIP